MNFDRVAPYYDFLAGLVFLGQIKKSQIDALEHIPPLGDVLVIGGGTGWIIPFIFRKGHIDRLYYLEASDRMLEKSRKRSRHDSGKVEFILGTEENLPDKKFDAIITNFFLDCFEPGRLRDIVNTLYGRLKPEGYWYLTDFQIGSSWYRRFWQLPMVWIMFWFFRSSVRIEARNLYSYSGLMQKYGLRLTHSKTYFGEFISSSIYRKIPV